MQNDFIGKHLDKIDPIIKYVEIENNFNVEGEKLITNAKCENDVYIFTTGRFIFDLKGKNND